MAEVPASQALGFLEASCPEMSRSYSVKGSPYACPLLLPTLFF